jgi:hypothetical protein
MRPKTMLNTWWHLKNSLSPFTLELLNKSLRPCHLWWMPSRWSTQSQDFTTLRTRWQDCSLRSQIKWSRTASKKSFHLERRSRMFGKEIPLKWLKFWAAA